ncbi:hypothetical protein Tco_0872023 [Tanacetum coccineum]
MPPMMTTRKLADELLHHEVDGRVDRLVKEVEELESKRAKVVDELAIKVAEELVGQLQDLLPTIVAQVGDHISNQGINGSRNDNVTDDSIHEDIRNVNMSNGWIGCSYKEFVACKAKEFDGKGDAVAYTRWVEKLEAVQDIIGCGDNQKVKYSADSLIGESTSFSSQRVKSLFEDLHSKLGYCTGSELDLASYRLFEDKFLATCKQELCPFGFLLASCQVSSSELQPVPIPALLCSIGLITTHGHKESSCIVGERKMEFSFLRSINHGPFELGTTRDTLGTTPEGGVLLGPERPSTYDDLNDNDKKRFDVDVHATNIVLQGLPKDIYKLINHNIKAKAIWDNVKMLLVGSVLTKEDRES